MKYIAIIHKEQGTAYGVTLPDFPGCFSAVDTLDEIPCNIQEAVELWAEGEEIEPPVPVSFEEVAQSEAAQGGAYPFRLYRESGDRPPFTMPRIR